MGILSDINIAFIGGGIMAEAFISGLLARQLVAPERIIASDPLAERREQLATQLGIRTTACNHEAIDEASIVVLAVKPQVLGRVLPEIAGKLAAEALVLSFVAGATIRTIGDALGVATIVRIMPNTPGQVGEGISVWTATAAVSAGQREQARAIVGALGDEVYVEEERYLDMATALSGSGPAYVFLFIEALTDAGVQMGFSRPVAERLALQTVRGSAIYAQKTGLHPAILRNRVTSPGGTTAEALYNFELGGFRASVIGAVLAAYRKARALGGAKGE